MTVIDAKCKGDTVLVIDGRIAGTAIVDGSYITIAGDDIPHRVVTSGGGTTPISLTITPGLARAVADDAVITEYVQGAVDNVAN